MAEFDSLVASNLILKWCVPTHERASIVKCILHKDGWWIESLFGSAWKVPWTHIFRGQTWESQFTVMFDFSNVRDWLVEINFEIEHSYDRFHIKVKSISTFESLSYDHFHIKVKSISTFGSLISLICPSLNLGLNRPLSFIQIKLFTQWLMLMDVWCCMYVFCCCYRPAHMMGITF